MTPKKRNHVTLFYGAGSGFSGQRFAIELIAQGLRERGWAVKVITTPLRDRVTAQSRPALILEIISLMLRLLTAWAGGLWAVFTAPALVVSPGQTRFALIRDGLPLLVKGLFSRDNPVAVSLHGNLLMNWPPASFEAKILRRMVRAACYVTILGPNQKAQLIRLGIPAAKIVIVDNTCAIPPVTPRQLTEKQAKAGPLTVLYLSSLIESKGYPEFVEAVAQLSRETDLNIEAVLCGTITLMDTDQRFQSIDQAKTWIESQIKKINQSPGIKIRWVNGAIGELKASLFREAHIFVLPSRYKVEAQPIAIIEALASGCAVITSTAGEIPAMVNPKTAILLAEVSPDTIAGAITDLVQNSNKRHGLASAGLQHFTKRFTYQTYIDRWDALLKSIVECQ